MICYRLITKKLPLMWNQDIIPKKISLSTSFVDFVMKGNSNTSENIKVNSISLNEHNNINNGNEINELSNNYSYDIEHTPNSNNSKNNINNNIRI